MLPCHHSPTTNSVDSALNLSSPIYFQNISDLTPVQREVGFLWDGFLYSPQRTRSTYNEPHTIPKPPRRGCTIHPHVWVEAHVVIRLFVAENVAHFTVCPSSPRRLRRQQGG